MDGRQSEEDGPDASQVGAREEVCDETSSEKEINDGEIVQEVVDNLNSRVLPQVPDSERVDISGDGFDAIDKVGGWDSFFCEFSVVDEVPHQHREVWTWAWGHVLRRIDQASDDKELDRGLMWLCFLPQALLRRPKRGGQSGRGLVAERFNCLVRRDWGALVDLWERDKILARQLNNREKNRNNNSSEEITDKKRREVLKLLAKGQVSRAVGKINSRGLANVEDPGVMEQLQAKYPDRKRDLPSHVTKASPVEHLRGLRESLLALKKGVSPGCGGLRPEFLTTLAMMMDPAQMMLLEDFGMRYLQGNLPAWFYAVWLSVQTVPLFKSDNAIRPIGIRNPLVKSFHKEVINDNREELISFFEPQQLAMTKGGASKLVNAVRMLAEERKDFVVVKNDFKNAFNEVSRSSIVESLEEEPSLQHLAWHAATTLAPVVGLETGGQLWGQGAEGATQGDPEAMAWFCVPWQKFLRQLDSTLSAAGGMARAGPDDLYAEGPAEVVFPALEIFWRQVKEYCGLDLQRIKTEVFTWSGTLPENTPSGLTIAGVDFDEGWHPGFLCYGVPVGTDDYVTIMLDKKVEELVESSKRTCSLLENERQGLWTILRSSLQYQFEYWAMLVHPTQVLAAAQRVDNILWSCLEVVAGSHIPKVCENLGWDQPLNCPVENLDGRSFQAWVVGLPVRLGGLGITSQVELSPIAYIGGLEQSLPYFGGEKGICPPLAHLVGEDSNTRWEPLLQSDCRTGQELARAWRLVQGEARESCQFMGKELEGALAVHEAGIGEGSTSGATRSKIVKERDEMRAQLMRTILSRSVNQRSRGLSSWKERDKLTNAWLFSLPGPHDGLSSPVFAEALSTLLCMPSRVCVDRVGMKVGKSRVDLFGEKIINENLPGGGWTRRHDKIKVEINSLCSYAGLPSVCEPYGVFSDLIPQQALSRIDKERRGQVLRPDIRLEISSENEVTQSRLADVKTIGLGGQSWYKTGFRDTENECRAVDRRAKRVQGEYELKAKKMDVMIGEEEGFGAVSRRLGEFGEVIALCFGGYGEGSSEVHKLIETLAISRVRSVQLRTGKAPDVNAVGAEVTLIRRRLSTAVVRANQSLLLSRLSYVGDGAGGADRRRQWARSEDVRMRKMREAAWLVEITGKELVRKGMFWLR